MLSTNQTIQSFCAVFETMADCILVIDKKSRVLFANPAAHTMLGYDSESLVAKNVKSLMPAAIAEHHDRFVDDYGQKPRTIIGQQRQVMAKKRNGDLFPIELAVSAHEVDGQHLFVGLIRDMTLRAKAEARAQERLHLLEMVEQMAGIGYWVLDLKTSQVTWSLEIYKIFGLDPCFYQPDLSTALDLYHPDDRETLVAILEQAQVDHKPFDFELRIIKNHTQVRYVRSRGHIELDHQNQPVTLFGIIEDITDFKEAQNRLESRNKVLTEATQRLRHQANTDNLTSLPNRRSFYHEAQHIISSSGMLEGGIGLLMIDIDYFKKINDTHGHDVGDKVLMLVADVLKLNTRGLDMVARLGGEEFVVLLPNSKYHHIQPIAERYRRTVAEVREPKVPSVTISVGATYASPEHLKQLSTMPALSLTDKLLKLADQALYQAKGAGRNQVRHMDLTI